MQHPEERYLAARESTHRDDFHAAQRPLLLIMIYENIWAREPSVHGGRSSAQSGSQNGTVRKLPSAVVLLLPPKSFQIELLKFSQHLILTVSSRRE